MNRALVQPSGVVCLPGGNRDRDCAFGARLGCRRRIAGAQIVDDTFWPLDTAGTMRFVPLRPACGRIAATKAGAWSRAYRSVREETERRAAPPLAGGPVRPVDADAKPDQVASRPTTWFFEQFVLTPHCAGLSTVR